LRARDHLFASLMSIADESLCGELLCD
jgi:hypothetical protein